MSDRKASQRLSLAVFVLLLLALATPAPIYLAQAAADQPPPRMLSPMRAPGSNAAGSFPHIAASPLLDQWRQQGGSKGASHLVDRQVLRSIQRDEQHARGAAHPSPAGPAHSAAQAAPGQPASAIPSAGAATPGAASGPGVRPYVAGARNAPAQASDSCVNLISDSQIYDPTNGNLWPVYAQKSYYDTSYNTSPPYSFLMIEKGAPAYPGDNDDSVVDTSRLDSPDFDAFGQVINVPNGTESITVSFNFRYDPGSAVLGDELFYEFYLADGNPPSQQNYIAGFPIQVANYANGGWWTQTTRFDDPTFLNAVQGQQVALVISTYNNVDSSYAVVRIDDIYAEACQPPATIQGRVTQTGASDLSDALILLSYLPPGGGDLQLLGLTLPDAGGNYQFTDVPALPAGGQYQIDFLNYSLTDTIDNTRVSFWAGPLISSLTAGQIVTAPSFDIKDVTLGNPDSYTQQVMAGSQLVTFNWQSRGVNPQQERYQFCIYDQETVYPGTTDPVYLCTSVLQPSDIDVLIGRSSFPADYAFRYDHPYSWYVVVYGAGSDLQTSQSGVSFYEHVVTFKQSIVSQPNNPPPPNPNPPPPQTGKAWTVMVYMAGDNNLGDTQRTPNPVSNLQGQWASLKALAAKYPNINLVTLTDFYGNTGTQFCYLRSAGAPQCQELGEQNTAAPATLSNFINKALSLYPAQHTMLIISDHGHSIAGVATDETTTNAPSMTPDQIRQAFAGANLSARKLDILFYNTCLMGSFEPAFDASAYAKYMVASSDLVWVLNLYDRLLPLLANTNAATVASGIVNAYGQSVDAIIPGSYRTMAAYDLARAGAVNTAVSALGQAMNANVGGSRAAVAAIRTQVQVYDSSGNDLLDQVLDTTGTHVVAQEEDAIVDLRHLATLLKNSTNPALAAAIKTAAGNLLTALGGGTTGQPPFVIAAQLKTGEGDGGGPKNFANASGLGIFFPNGERYGGQPTLADAYLYQGAYAQLNAATQWDDFLRSYVSGTIAQGRGGIARGRGGIARGGRPFAGGTVPPKLFLPIVRR
jgi:Clostripain family